MRGEDTVLVPRTSCHSSKFQPGAVVHVRALAHPLLAARFSHDPLASSRCFHCCCYWLYTPPPPLRLNFRNIYRQARTHLTESRSSPETVHGALLALGELLSNSGDFMVMKFSESCDLVLKYKDSRNKLVRILVHPSPTRSTHTACFDAASVRLCACVVCAHFVPLDLFGACRRLRLPYLFHSPQKQQPHTNTETC